VGVTGFRGLWALGVGRHRFSRFVGVKVGASLSRFNKFQMPFPDSAYCRLLKQMQNSHGHYFKKNQKWTRKNAIVEYLDYQLYSAKGTKGKWRYAISKARQNAPPTGGRQI